MQEKILKAKPGMPFVVLFILLYLAAIAFIIIGGNLLSNQVTAGAILLAIGIIWTMIGYIPFFGFKIIKPQEALVLTVFGKYTGTLKEPGFYFVNPFSVAVNPAYKTRLGQSDDVATVSVPSVKVEGVSLQSNYVSKKISLKVMTLSNRKQKINDALGNPVEVGIAVVWRVVDTAKAVFNVDNYKEYLSLQCDGALRDIVRIYPYDVNPGIDTTGDGEPDEGSLRGSSKEVAERIRDKIQSKVENAGIEILEARITHLAYAQEIASAMLQRQQASAIIDARKMIVDGAVGMVEMALEMLNEKEVVELDEERKAAMVSNLLVVLCGNRDAQPIINSGSLY
ncbi:MAG TPA: SPFH domain-containing protein [Defluviitaleaceae bacterium]|nr:SPFH domain-containing protein [Defluviitaleaceae bacterium]